MELVPSAPSGMLDALLTALDAEKDGLDRLAACADAQLEALHAGTPGALAEPRHATGEALAALEGLSGSRARLTAGLAQALGVRAATRLADVAAGLPAADGRRLLAARDAVRTAARGAQARCDALAFALEYAADLGRETIAAWRALAGPRPARAYTADGTTAPSPPAGPVFVSCQG